MSLIQGEALKKDDRLLVLQRVGGIAALHIASLQGIFLQDTLFGRETDDGICTIEILYARMVLLLGTD